MLFGQIALHFLHVRVKTDGQHAVGLVKDQHTQVLEVQRAAQQVVQHAARRAHNDLSPLAQGVHLFFVAHAAVHGHGPDAGIRENHGGLAFHLHGQLTRGSEHQGLRGLEFRIQAGQHGQQIAAGLAAARARLDHDVPPFQQIGQSQGLHRHQALPARAGTSRAHGFRQVGQADFGQGVFRLADGEFLRGEGSGVFRRFRGGNVRAGHCGIGEIF